MNKNQTILDLKNIDEPMFKALQPLEVFGRRKPSSHQKFTPGTNNRIGGMPNLQKNDFGIYEAVEFVNRQSKNMY